MSRAKKQKGTGKGQTDRALAVRQTDLVSASQVGSATPYLRGGSWSCVFGSGGASGRAAVGGLISYVKLQQMGAL